MFAMQALFEDDLTEHDLEEILQHLGERERREHGEYFSRVRGESRKAAEDIGFLARDATNAALGLTIAHFQTASETVIDGLFVEPSPSGAETGDDETAEDVVPRNRPRLEKMLKAALAELRTNLEAVLQRPGTDDPVKDDETREADLARLQAGANRRLEEMLATEERTSREAVMDLMSRTVRLARGVVAQRAAIDPMIERAAPAFPIPQLASIDRAVLRIAVYELMFEPDVPFKAVINEGVEIAKRFGGPNSGRFVNGVLRTISETLPAARKEPVPRP